MSTPDFFRSRLDGMVDSRHPLVVLTGRLPWAQIEQVLAPHFARKARPAGTEVAQDMLGEHQIEFGGGVSSAGRPRLPIRLMASLLYLKNSFNLSDEELVARWSENVVWQFFSGMAYYEPRLPCDATQIGRFRTAIGEEGLEQLLKFTIQTAVEMKAIKPAELERGTSGFHSAREGDCAPGGQPLAGDRALQVGQGRQGRRHRLEADLRG